MWAALYIFRVPNYSSVNGVNENQLDCLVNQTCKKCIKMQMKIWKKWINKNKKVEKETTAEEM